MFSEPFLSCFSCFGKRLELETVEGEDWTVKVTYTVFPGPKFAGRIQLYNKIKSVVTSPFSTLLVLLIGVDA